MLYITALILFFAIHSVPVNRTLRDKIASKVGEVPYQGGFALIALGGIAGIVLGWRGFPNTYFYEPPILLKQINLAIMFPVVYLWVSAESPNNLKRYIRNPMLTGVVLWALGHMLANGDLRSLILFVSFMIYSIIAMVAANRKEGWSQPAPLPWTYDLGVLVVSAIGYSVVAYFHLFLFGMPVLHYSSIGWLLG